MHADGAHRVVNLQHPLHKHYGAVHYGGGDGADDHGGPGVNEGDRGGDAHQAGQRAVAGHQYVGLAFGNQGDVEGDHGAGGAGQQGVDRVQADVAAGVDVEAEPAEEQDEGADDDEGRAVGRQFLRLAAYELADAGANHEGAGQRDETAHRVHHAGAGVVLRAQRAQEAVAPDPVAVDGVNQRRDDEAVGQIGL